MAYKFYFIFISNFQPTSKRLPPDKTSILDSVPTIGEKHVRNIKKIFFEKLKNGDS
jgi:hypothetical protein